MDDLLLCTACARHLRRDETRCPFCGAALLASLGWPLLFLLTGAGALIWLGPWILPLDQLKWAMSAGE